MGEISDMIQDGLLCMDCGCALEVMTGFPRKCPDCFKEDRIKKSNYLRKIKKETKWQQKLQ